MVCPTNVSGFFMHNGNQWVEIRSPFVNLWLTKPHCSKLVLYLFGRY